MDSLERRQPQAIEAEQAVLGSLMVSPAMVDEIASVLNPADFYLHQHQTLYRAILAVHGASDPVDFVTVTTWLHDTGGIADFSGTQYLMDLAASIPSAASAPHYARIVKRKAEQRQAIAVGLKIAELGYDDEHQAPLETAAQLLFDAAGSPEGEVQPLAEIVPVVRDEIQQAIADYQRYQGERISGRVLTGLFDLDGLTLGMGQDHLVIVAGRPGSGKSALMFQVARNIAGGKGTGEPLPVVAFSLEMGKSELVKRMQCGIASVSGERVTQGVLTTAEQDSLDEAARYLAGLPLYIDDASNVTVARIRSVSRRLKARHGRLGAVVVDYLQLMGEPDGGRRRAGNRQEEVSAISRGLKMLARELGCPVIAGSQLNRGSADRADNRPRLTDLRESGSLEQDANLVLLIHRDELTNPESTKKGRSEIIAAKNRGGRTGSVEVGFNAPTTHFFDLTYRHGEHRIAAPPRPTITPPTPATPPEPWSGASVEDWSHMGLDD